ncbi:MAG: GatB/YqeY domain-containing protein [Gammaproteobacteria bacterium]|nr:GatB/YqeY domain-containing protein [Gammaproteobacteria bacterium]
MSLKQQLLDDVKVAMRAGDKLRLQTLRMTTAAIKQREVDERVELEDADVMAIVEKMIKQRRDAEQQYAAAGRAELAAQEADEIAILEHYLPAQLDDDAIQAAIASVLAEADITGMQDMGRAMGILKQRLQGQADMARVSALLRQQLQS